MKIEFLDDIKDEQEREYLQSMDVILEDYDYILIFEYDENIFGASNVPKNCNIQRLLNNGCGENKWYRLIFRGSEKILGIAYHG